MRAYLLYVLEKAEYLSKGNKDQIPTDFPEFVVEDTYGEMNVSYDLLNELDVIVSSAACLGSKSLKSSMALYYDVSQNVCLNDSVNN
jgi:hypothetical protein